MFIFNLFVIEYLDGEYVKYCVEHYHNLEKGDKIIYDEANLPFKNFDIRYSNPYACANKVYDMIGIP